MYYVSNPHFYDCSFTDWLTKQNFGEQVDYTAF